MSETKKWYKSREVFVLATASLLIIAEALGLDFQGIWADAQNLIVSVAPVIALVLRLFFTKSKLTL